MNLLAVGRKVSDGALLLFGFANLGSHALGDMLTEYPHFGTLGHECHVHEHGKSMIMFIAIIHELRKEQMRCKRYTAAVNSKSAIPPGIGNIPFDITRKRRADIHNRSKPSLALFLFNVGQSLINREIAVSLMVELAVFQS